MRYAYNYFKYIKNLPLKTKKKIPSRGRRLGRDAWITAAKDALINGGVDSIKIERLAATLNAERGTFYHHFDNREMLLEELLEHWKANNSRPYEDAMALEDSDAIAKMEYINNMWLEEKTYDPDYDAGMRDWARTDKKIARVVRRVEQKRIKMLETVFLDLGYDGNEALVRARVAYFHQVGYLALGLGETRKRRRELAPFYLDIFLGC